MTRGTGSYTPHLKIERASRPGAPWVVFSNSLAADLSMWDGQVETLRQAFNILRYDNRGHGGSATAPLPCTLDDLVDDALAAMDTAGIEQADFVGISLGGMVGLGLALRAPHRLKRLLCCGARADMPAAAIAIWDQRIAAVRRDGLDAVADDTIGRWLAPAFRARFPDRVARVRRMICATSVAGYAGCVEAIKSLAYLERLSAIGVPTLYATGELDPSATPDLVRDMAARTPGAAVEIIAGAAHLPNIDSAAAFDALLRRHLGS